MSPRSRKPSPSSTRLRSHQRCTEAQIMRDLDEVLYLQALEQAAWQTRTVDQLRDDFQPPRLPERRR